MIEAKNFRLGNYVYGALGEVCVIEQLGAPGNPNFVGYREIGTSINFGQNGQKPIPLDENILLKCGDAEIKFFCKVVIVLERFLFLWKEEYKYWYVLTFENQVYLTKIEYLHEYQNFIFSLTGKELEVSL